ncbi:MAG: hypothetical protein GWN58_58285, partial [Anaerolineae bacterium]|nr:hypothetical protein [Anaerolineae bacterium]
ALPKPLQRAVEHLRNGELPAARRLLVPYVKENPRSDVAWYLLSFALEDEGQQRKSLRRSLSINPDNQKAKRRWQQLTAGDRRPSPQAATKPPSTAREASKPVASQTAT